MTDGVEGITDVEGTRLVGEVLENPVSFLERAYPAGPGDGAGSATAVAGGYTVLEASSTCREPGGYPVSEPAHIGVACAASCVTSLNVFKNFCVHGADANCEQFCGDNCVKKSGGTCAPARYDVMILE